jgi:hypothetical protein
MPNPCNEREEFAFHQAKSQFNFDENQMNCRFNATSERGSGGNRTTFCAELNFAPARFELRGGGF